MSSAMTFDEWDKKTWVVNSATTVRDRQTLWDAVREVKDLGLPGVILEVGSAWGRTALILSGACVAFGLDVPVHCIDIWSRYQDWNGANTYIPLEVFQSNIDKLGMSHRVVAHRGSSRTHPWGADLALLFIDGEHTYATVRSDLRRFVPFVVEGGVILCHDYVYIPDVQRAVEDACVELRLELQEITGANLARLARRR